MDASGFNLWTSRTRGRALRGQRAIRLVGGRTGPNLSMIMAASNIRGLIHHNLREGGTNINVFNQFLESASQAAGDGRLTFILDNTPCHRRAAEAVLRVGHTVRHLPANRPLLS